jgi:hypothetical protein
MVCDEKGRLFSEYNSAVVELSNAVNNLVALAGTSSADDYRVLGLEKDRARARLGKARAAYEKHIAEHRCNAPDESIGSFQ